LDEAASGGLTLEKGYVYEIQCQRTIRRAVAYVLEEIFCIPAKPDIRLLARAAVIAALYAALTLLLAAISFGPVQFRVSEALTLLPIRPRLPYRG
jgi:hypothetical protein